MKVKVVETTGGKYLGRVFDIPEVNKDIALRYGIEADEIVVDGNIYIIRNPNYTIKLERIEE